MKYIKLFEELEDNIKNKILLIDSSGSFQYIMRDVIEKDKINLYLADRFDVIFCSFEIDNYLKNIMI
jgi:hypothetical protein